jgi:hypothetical protein
MPSDKEIQESGVSVYGTVHLNDPCKLGEIAVVKFYDHVDAIAAANHSAFAFGIKCAHKGRKRGEEDMLAKCIAAVEAVHDPENPRLLPRWVKADAIAALRALQEKP